MNIENSQLRILLSVSREGSYSGAAKKLNITQSAVSQAVRNIENKLEIKLFLRQANKMIVTQEGSQVVSFASQHIIKMNNFFDSLGKSKNEICGEVTVGTFFGIGKSWLANLCLEISKKYPELKIAINLSTIDFLVKSFHDNEINMLILPEEEITFSYEKKVCVGMEALVLVFPKRDEYKITSKITIEELSEIPTILFEKENDHLFNKWCKSVYKKYPKKINKRFVINSHGNILHAVSEGLGIAVVPKHVLDRSFYKKKVKYLEDRVINSGKIYLIFKNDDLSLKRNATVIDEIKKYYQQNNYFSNA